MSAEFISGLSLHKYVDSNTAIFWFRRDLRLDDNTGLHHALKENDSVLPLFIFDTEILDQLDDKQDKRVSFIYFNIQLLKTQLEKLGSSLLVLYGNPVEIFKDLLPKCVYTNHDYEPYAIKRDSKVAGVLELKGSRLFSYKDQVIFEKDEIVKDDHRPYTVFTPFSKKWKLSLTGSQMKSFPDRQHFNHLKKISPLPLPSLKEIGFENVSMTFPKKDVDESIIKSYQKKRDFPALDATSHLSVHLRFGTVSIRKVVQAALKKSETWLNELIWREFYQMILWHFPNVVSHSFRNEYDKIVWRNNENEFESWCNGTTGYPIVDAGMRELNETGFMHNRVRMITASFLTKHLLIDWRWGEAYFAKKLLDYDLASNNGNWQWAAGTGCDAAPYFRIFNPSLQANRFDPKREYIRKWVPEFENKNYHKPIVEHVFARERALRTYRSALS